MGGGGNTGGVGVVWGERVSYYQVLKVDSTPPGCSGGSSRVYQLAKKISSGSREGCHFRG